MKTNMNKMYRLADSTVVEPLINLWPAWSHMIPPVTASLHLLHHQITTLQSYLNNPSTHLRLANDPKFAGGPFGNVPVDRADEMRELLLRTQDKQRANLELARAITQFHNWLVDEANGQSLDPYYEQMPALLRGYTELVYDYYHNPTLRFLESMLYESEYYDTSLQSLRLFQLRRDSRPFFLSTPRLKDETQIAWNVPFESAVTDDLFQLDIKPQPLSRIRELLPPEIASDRLLLSMLSEEPVCLPERWRERRVRVKYFGHACVLIECNGVSILTDPCVSARPAEGGLARFSYNDLPERIDFALVTHTHQDHFVLETLLRLRSRIECLVVPRAYGVLFGDISLKLLSQKVGFKQVLELDTLESIPLPDGEIVGIPFFGEHGDLVQGKIAYLVKTGQERILCAADSDCLDKRMYERICKIVGPIDNVFLGTESVGGPLTWHNGSNFLRRPTPQQNRTRRYHGCDASRALDLLEAIKARRIYIYAMGKEPWYEHLLGLGTDADTPQLKESRQLISRARARGFKVAERPFGKGEIYLGFEETGGSANYLRRGRTDSFIQNARELESPTSGDVERSLAYWREQLGDSLPVFALPKTEAAEETVAPGQQSVTISAGLSNALAEFCRRHGHSLLALTLAAFQTLLRWYTEHDDIVIGAQADDLRSCETVSQSDSLSNFIALRTDLSGEPDFLHLLDRVRAVIQMALSHAEVPCELLVETLRVDAIPARPHFCQVMFRFIRESAQPVSTPFPVAVRGCAHVNCEQAKKECILALILCEQEQGMTVALHYDAESFDGATIAAMLDHYLSLLDNLVTDPEQIITHVLLGVSVEKGDDGLASLGHSRHLEDQFVF